LFQLLGGSDTSKLTSPTFDFSGARGAGCQSRKPKGCENGAALTATEAAC